MWRIASVPVQPAVWKCEGNFRHACWFAVTPVDTAHPVQPRKQQDLVVLPAALERGLEGAEGHVAEERAPRAECASPGLTGIVYFSYVQQIFMKCLCGPGAILGNGSRLPYHIIHKRLVVLTAW